MEVDLFTGSSSPAKWLFIGRTGPGSWKWEVSLGDQTAMEFISSVLRSTLRRANGFQSLTTNLLLEPFGEKLLLEFTASSIEYVSHW